MDKTIKTAVSIDYKSLEENFGKNFGISSARPIKHLALFYKIIFPAAFPYIIVGLHIALGSAWVFLVAGEMIGAQSGLGFMIIDARNNLRPDLLIVGIITIGFIGLILDKTISFFEKWIGKHWGIISNERGA